MGIEVDAPPTGSFYLWSAAITRDESLSKCAYQLMCAMKSRALFDRT
jgi:hypothetical protein